MTITRVRVELKRKFNDNERNFKDMFREFRNKVSDAGILHSYREHAFFESPGEKRRRKRREMLAKIHMAEVEKKVLAGERVKASAGLIKKILNNAKKRRPSRNEE